MTGDQWFDLWLALIQVSVGAIVAVTAAYIAARLALKHERVRVVEERSRRAAEDILGVIQDLGERLVLLHGSVNFVLQPPPVSIGEAKEKGVDANALAQEAAASLARQRLGAGLLSKERLREQFTWALFCAIDLQLMVAAATFDQRRYSMVEIADAAGEAAGYLHEYSQSLRAYLLKQEPPAVRKPTYWRSPVDQFAEPQLRPAN